MYLCIHKNCAQAHINIYVYSMYACITHPRAPHTYYMARNTLTQHTRIHTHNTHRDTHTHTHTHRMYRSQRQMQTKTGFLTLRSYGPWFCQLLKTRHEFARNLPILLKCGAWSHQYTEHTSSCICVVCDAHTSLLRTHTCTHTPYCILIISIQTEWYHLACCASDACSDWIDSPYCSSRECSLKGKPHQEGRW